MERTHQCRWTDLHGLDIFFPRKERTFIEKWNNERRGYDEKTGDSDGFALITMIIIHLSPHLPILLLIPPYPDANDLLPSWKRGTLIRVGTIEEPVFVVPEEKTAHARFIDKRLAVLWCPSESLKKAQTRRILHEWMYLYVDILFVPTWRFDRTILNGSLGIMEWPSGRFIPVFMCVHFFFVLR